MSASATSSHHIPVDTDPKLQLLQLQCIVDAKDREISILRRQLSCPEDSDEKSMLQSEVARLHGELQQLRLENNALHAQSDAANARNTTIVGLHGSGPQQHLGAGNGAGNQMLTKSTHPGHGTGPVAACPHLDGKSNPVSTAAGQSVDTGALVEKLRGLVMGLVSEALTAQMGRKDHYTLPASSLPLRQPLQGLPAPSAADAIHAGGIQAWVPAASQGPPASSPVHMSPGVKVGHQVPPRSAQEPAAEMGSHTAHASTSAGGSEAAAEGAVASVRVEWPGVQIVIQQAPTVQQQPEVRATREANTSLQSSGIRRQGGGEPAAGAPGPTKMEAGAAAAVLRDADVGASVPAVLELNVDGTVVLVDRAVLESQAAGSQLHRMLIQGYGKLPLDSQGRPYLSFDPRVFQLLLSYLKERHLFGRAAPAKEYWRMADGLGVPRHYFMQSAMHFGLANLVTPLARRDANASELASAAAPADSTCGPCGVLQQASDRAALATHANSDNPEGLPAPASVAGGQVHQRVDEPWDQLPSLRLPPYQHDTTANGALLGGKFLQLPLRDVRPWATLLADGGDGGDSGPPEVLQLPNANGTKTVFGSQAAIPAAADTVITERDKATGSSCGPAVEVNDANKTGSRGAVSPLSADFPDGSPPLSSQQVVTSQGQEALNLSPNALAPALGGPGPANGIPAISTAAPARQAAEAPSGPGAGSLGANAGVLGWWQPFPDEGVPSTTPQEEPVVKAYAIAAADAAAWPLRTAPPAGTVERYRVANMYEVLANKQRLEFENEGGKDA